LDGLRAISVGLVIVSHEALPSLNFLPQGIRNNGAIGVIMFFVLSGFLITRLLLVEIDRFGRLNIARFYARRAFRIFPPFYVYILVAAAAGALHLYPNPPGIANVLAAATYTVNYVPRYADWVLGHAWTLCIEEQFYLFWPLCLAFVPRRSALWIAVAVFALSPFIRVANYYIDPQSLGGLGRMFHTHADGLMIGCCIALAADQKTFGRILRAMRHPFTVSVAVCVIVFISPLYRDSFRQSIGFTLDALCCASVMMFAVSHENTWLGRIINSSLFKHVGVISYSLYLWQQLFTGPNNFFRPWNLLAVLACAEASYWWVERPSLRLRDRVLGSFQFATARK
jgi:peptidoglycan/LPS O-acetylase OafA/YrhL